jgi:hypothetical protein
MMQKSSAARDARDWYRSIIFVTSSWLLFLPLISSFQECRLSFLAGGGFTNI